MRRIEVLAVVAVWCAVPQLAWAYLDAGSASILFQAAAASVFTALFVLKSYWAQVRAWFGRRPPASEDAAARVKPDEPSR